MSLCNARCQVLFIIMLNDNMLNDVMLFAVMLRIIMPSGFLPNAEEQSKVCAQQQQTLQLFSQKKVLRYFATSYGGFELKQVVFQFYDLESGKFLYFLSFLSFS